MTGVILSIDIGSVAVSAVELSVTGNLISKHYRYHDGQPARVLREIICKLQLDRIVSVVSPSESVILASGVQRIDTQSSYIKASLSCFGNADAILLVGAGRFQLMHFDKLGKFTFSGTNTSCAAGTGSFLDQQAGRLDLMDTKELCELAERNTGEMPDIASRCSVFAKTDLIHAQQAGYSLESICDSLCKGLARNIADTLFDEEHAPGKVIFVGGVSKNLAVIRHLRSFIRSEFVIHEDSHLFAAIGAGLIGIGGKKTNSGDRKKWSIEEIINSELLKREYVFDPLSLKLSNYPDFKGSASYNFKPSKTIHTSIVQTDIYGSEELLRDGLFIGIDIGSTSTKAILTGWENKVFAGFYTYTAGQPLAATLAVFEAILDFFETAGVYPTIRAVGTTGSGRKFIGSIIGADQVIDEITTHARAAVELNPETDTIIEIGGQDAKFTLLRNGRVTFSKMNSVCAAGTGSFIEEQASRIGISLNEYSSVAEGAGAPLASDRCTVFMERDINHYFNQGYERPEILAAVLHSVRDNYLKKVAIESNIGSSICFQGATAKNRALVAAFEAKLEKEIYVSKYCHLTGALGTALLLSDEHNGVSSFRGLDIINEKINLRSEVCELCTNNCRISIATVKGEDVAYGFLCGRDYNVKKYVDQNVSGFDLLSERKKISYYSKSTGSDKTLIGLPATVHMYNDLKFWKVFFDELGMNVITSEQIKDPLTSGKRLAGAEFCAPIHALYGHIKYLNQLCDYIFIPATLDNKDAENPYKENYCYYTQFSPSIVSLINDKIKQKSLTPVLFHEKGEKYVIDQLYKSLINIDKTLSVQSVKEAWQKAGEVSLKEKLAFKKLLNANFFPDDNLSVVILGRPYLALAASLNKGIPGIFGGMGIKCFYQDMLDTDSVHNDELNELLRSMPWHFAVEVLEAALYISMEKGLYPVFVTGFKCAPDSFVIEYFQKLMDSSGKPYLILQIDEHDSNVGYETRIEAAIRSFRIHYNDSIHTPTCDGMGIGFPRRTLSKEKVVLYPNWDQLGGPLLAASFRRFGYTTHLLKHTELGIQKAMSTNTGQCLPLNIIAQDGIEYIKSNNLDPANTTLWIAETKLTCNIRMYPQFIKTIFENHGQGMEKVEVYSGEIAHNELSVRLTYYAFFAYMFSGLIRRVGCRLRPYELNAGETNKAIDYALNILIDSFEGGAKLDGALKKALKPFYDIRVANGQKPLVAIFGDFFLRDNDVMNQGLIYDIEKYGGEVHTTPYSEFYNLAFENVMRRKAIREGYFTIIGLRGLSGGLNLIQNRFYRHFEPFLGKKKPSLSPLKNEKNLDNFNIDLYHSGESYDNLLKIFHIKNMYPKTRLFVQTNPAFCCPSLITEAMKTEIRKHTGIPIVTITYDGTTERKNDILAPYFAST